MCILVHVQHRTLEAALDRGEKLDDLVGKSEELSLHSKAFYTTVGTTYLYLLISLCPYVSLSVSLCLSPVHIIIQQMQRSWQCVQQIKDIGDWQLKYRNSGFLRPADFGPNNGSCCFALEMSCTAGFRFFGRNCQLHFETYVLFGSFVLATCNLVNC